MYSKCPVSHQELPCLSRSLQWKTCQEFSQLESSVCSSKTIDNAAKMYTALNTETRAVCTVIIIVQSERQIQSIDIYMCWLEEENCH